MTKNGKCTIKNHYAHTLKLLMSATGRNKPVKNFRNVKHQACALKAHCQKGKRNFRSSCKIQEIQEQRLNRSDNERNRLLKPKPIRVKLALDYYKKKQ